jgi:cytoskeletal protein CcmA (bactofilin family)
MCKRCSGHVDLRDYEFTSTVSKNFKTKGRCLLHEGACLLNTESMFGHAIIKGKVIGRIAADTLELHKTAEIKGAFTAGTLIIPADTVFRWRETVAVKGADIAGELVANLQAGGVVKVRATGRLFGNITGGGLEVENGAVIVGSMKIGVREPEPVVAPAATARIIPLPKSEPALAMPRR